MHHLYLLISSGIDFRRDVEEALLLGIFKANLDKILEGTVLHWPRGDGLDNAFCKIISLSNTSYFKDI